MPKVIPEEVVLTCPACGEEILPFDDVYVVEGEILHAAWECVIAHVSPRYYGTLQDALEELEKEGLR
jgi:hypothetical protein